MEDSRWAWPCSLCFLGSFFFSYCLDPFVTFDNPISIRWKSQRHDEPISFANGAERLPFILCNHL